LSSFDSPPFGARPLRLLERLTNAVAVSGDEGAVRRIVLQHIRPLADEVRVDALGNVLAVKRGRGRRRLRVMVAAHMDEVGFMLTRDEGKGLFRFAPVGGVDRREILGKALWVGAEKIPAVIGMTPIHLTSPASRSQTPGIEALRIDVGPENAAKVSPGMRATFATSFLRQGPSVRAKALDDRLGVALLVELFRHAPENIDLLAAFTVQEELGLRGAQVAAFALEPDVAFVVDCTHAYDLPTFDDTVNTAYNARLGYGPAIYVADRGTISSPRLVQHVAESAAAAGIPYQLRQAGGGRTDATTIHKQRGGIPSISISTPGRYLHRSASVARVADWKNTFALVFTALQRLTPRVIS